MRFGLKAGVIMKAGPSSRAVTTAFRPGINAIDFYGL